MGVSGLRTGKDGCLEILHSPYMLCERDIGWLQPNTMHGLRFHKQERASLIQLTSSGTDAERFEADSSFTMKTMFKSCRRSDLVESMSFEALLLLWRIVFVVTMNSSTRHTSPSAENYRTYEDQELTLYISLLVMATIAVVLRFVARARTIVKIGLDDWLIIPALAFHIAISGYTFGQAASGGFGYDLAMLPLPLREQTTKVGNPLKSTVFPKQMLTFLP